MVRRSSIDQFGLYGEGQAQISPEFVHIESISQRSRLHDGTIAPHAHPGIFQILLLQTGSGILAIEGSETPLLPGALAILPAGCVHAFRFAGDAEGAVLSLALDLFDDPRIGLLCASARKSADGPGMVWLEPGSSAYARLVWLMDDLVALLAKDRAGVLPDSAAARIALLMTLVDEVSASRTGDSGRHRLQDPRVRTSGRFRDLVEAHFRHRWTVADYARELGTTVPTLTRTCRATLAKAPAEVVHDRIMLEAMRRLTYATASVGQIATDLGFAEPGYFARFFRKRAGMTASQFRRERAWLRARQPHV